METTIEIKREAVFRQVVRRSEWQGTRSPDDRDYDRLALSEADRTLFQAFFDEAAMHAIDICRPFLRKASNTDAGLTLTVAVTEGPDSGSLPKTAENMAVCHVLGLWQEIVSPARAEATFSRRDDHALKLQGILYHHPAPTRANA